MGILLQGSGCDGSPGGVKGSNFEPPGRYFNQRMAKISIRDLVVEGQEVLMRVDFNVPLEDGRITDDTRIQGALPSIRHLVDGGAKLVLCSHLGRPKGESDPRYSLRPVASKLGELLGREVLFSEDCVGEEALAQRQGLVAGGLLLLANSILMII